MAVTALFGQRASASVYSWDSGSAVDSFWSTAANWSSDTKPTSTDTASLGATAVAPTRTPVLSTNETPGRISIDNSGGYVWSIDRDLGQTTNRSFTLAGVDIGGGVIQGLNVVGGGTTTILPLNMDVSAAQTWNVGDNTTVKFESSLPSPPAPSIIGGAGLITKTGNGTLILPASLSTKTGGWAVTGGTLVNQRSNNGLGATGAIVSVYNGGTYEIRNNIVSSNGATFYNGATLRGNGSTNTGFADLQTFSIDSTADANVTFTTANSTDFFSLKRGLTGGTANSVVNFTGLGTIQVLDGSATTYAGKWKVSSGNVIIAAQNSFNGKAVELAGGTLRYAAGANGSYALTPSNYTVTGSSVNLFVERNTTANTGNTTRSTLGTLTTGASTVNFGIGSFINGAQTAALSYSNLTLTGTPTINVASGLASDGTSAVTLQTIFTGTTTGGTNGITKTGSGQLRLNGAATYSGVTTVSGGTLAFGTATGGLTTSKFDIGSGATVELNNGASSANWATSAALSGSGKIQLVNNTQTLQLNGSTITPGGAGSSGIFTVASSGTNGTTNLQKNGSTFSSLQIDVTGGGAVAGTDYDQFVSPFLTNLANSNLAVTLGAVTQADLTGDVLTIVSAPGTNFTGQSFANVSGGLLSLANGASAQVNYLNGSITLSNFTNVPEPTSLAALGLTAAAMIRRRRTDGRCA